MRTPEIRPLQNRHRVARASKTEIRSFSDRCINALYYRFPLSLRDVRAGCLSDSLLAASTQTPPELAALNRDVRHLRDAIYSQIGGWDAPA
jgi:hypothetical protein